MKKAISIRLDNEIIDFYKKNFPQGYQIGISLILKKHMQSQQARMSQLLGRAQQIFETYHTQCFWHMRKNLEITEELLPMIKMGLRRHGGRRGFQLAAVLDGHGKEE